MSDFDVICEFSRAASNARFQIQGAVLRQWKLNWVEFVVLRELRLADRPVDIRELARAAGTTKSSVRDQVLPSLCDTHRHTQWHQVGPSILMQLTARGVQTSDELLPAAEDEAAFVLKSWADEQIEDIHECSAELLRHLDGKAAVNRRRHWQKVRMTPASG